MQRFSIDIEEEYSYIVYGISASTRDYRMCWSLNKELGFAFKRQDSLMVYSKKSDPTPHGYFIFEDENLQVKYRLVENKKGRSKFLAEAEKADYLFIADESPAIDSGDLIKKIKSIRPVLMVFKIELDSLKHKENLLLTA